MTDDTVSKYETETGKFPTFRRNESLNRNERGGSIGGDVGGSGRGGG